VDVVDARHDGPATEVDDPGARPGERLDLGGAADSLDHAPTQGEGLGDRKS
jgi:hypothetical protein